ncbi:uncharacterized protein ACN427_014589 isoform 1-T6 [Glossina fuscipes fuscipes]
MMLLPSGRSNGDVHSPLNNKTKPAYLTRATTTATTQLNNPNSNVNRTENGSYALSLSQMQAAAITTAAATMSLQSTLSSATSPSSITSKHNPVTTANSKLLHRPKTPPLRISTTILPSASTPYQKTTETTAATTPRLSTSNTDGSQSDIGPLALERFTNESNVYIANGVVNSQTNASSIPVTSAIENWEENDRYLKAMQIKLKEGWSVHVGNEGRLYYCNHSTQTSSWLPSCEDWSKQEDLPFGWERGIDSKGRSYYINHLNKTSTYEAPECVRWDEHPPEPRVVLLQRSPTMGFGFVAGSERPVIVRFVTEDGPSMDKLQPGDQILSVNEEDVKDAPRDRVIQLVRACDTQVTLTVCQPVYSITPGRKSTLLSAGKKAKLKTRPSRVRFAESVCVNGAPLFPPSAFSLGDICVPPMANVLKVFLENGQTKSFKYDTTTTVQDVVTSLLDKLCFTTREIFSLVLEHVKSLKRNKLTLLDPEESLARIASRPGAHKLRCLFRVTFVPISAADLAQKDLNALDYLYMQCCNDVTQERFAPELQPELALRLAALHMHQHALSNNVTPAKLTVKVVEREFGLERFVPTSLFEGMKRKELRRLISHFLKLNAEMTGSSTKVLTQLQAKLHYLDIIASLPSYGAKCFSTNQREGLERVLLVSPRFGLSQISSARNAVPQPVSAIEDFNHVVVNREDDVNCSVSIFIQGDRVIKFFMEDRDACEFSLCLAGYYRLITGRDLPLAREREPVDDDNAPAYLAQHTVLPAAWSYLKPYHNRPHSINFLMSPPYHPSNKVNSNELIVQDFSLTLCDKNMNSKAMANSNHTNTKKMPFISPTALDLDIHSVVATELLEEAKDSGMSDSSGGGGSNYGGERSQTNSICNAKMEAKNEEVLRRVQEMQKMVESSEQYLNEQGEIMQEYCLTTTPGRSCPMGKNCGESDNLTITTWKTPISIATDTVCATNIIEFDSDCDSLNSSKVSSNEETPQTSALKHSDSLVLLAETINQDLSGINQGLNSIGGHQADLRRRKPSLSETSSPRPERKVNGFSQLLSNLQALGTDLSQSESDSESVASPTNSPTIRRPSLLNTNDKSSRKQNLANRSSFGLHSPDSNTFGVETKDYNLKEYLKQLKEISNVDNFRQDTDIAAKKLSEIYGFEIRGDTFIETDTDLIDLRAIPPPQTPDELDALSLLNAAPQGFDDIAKKSLAEAAEGDLDKFLEKVVVAPPTQKATPAKELTPEEIMSYIIPPPPNLDDVENNTKKEDMKRKNNHVPESLYSNSAPNNREKPAQLEKFNSNEGKHIIEYATVERRSKFSCCPKSRKDEMKDVQSEIKLPPRSQSLEQSIPARPPKSAELVQRYSPKKQPLGEKSWPRSDGRELKYEESPPMLPPRINYNATSPRGLQIGNFDEQLPILGTMVSPLAPKKPPLPPIVTRPFLRKSPLPTNYPLTADIKTSPPSIQPRPFQSPSSCNSSAAQSPTLPTPQTPTQTQLFQQYHSTKSGDHRDQQARPSPVYPLLYSPQMSRKLQNASPVKPVTNNLTGLPANITNTGTKLIIKNGHVIDAEQLLVKTDVAMAGLLVKLDQVAAQCTAAQAAGGGTSIDEEKFQRARNELTEQTLALVTASKFLVVAMSDMTLLTLPEHLTSCLTAIRRITELTQDMTRHTSAPLQTRNIVLKVHDVASSFRELVGVQIGPLGAGQLALQAECLANVLATLLRSLRVFSP